MQIKDPEIKFIDNRDFTGGLNTLDDPVNLANNESPYMVNMDITKQGGMITRFGYELVSTISGSGATRGLLTYYKTYDDNTTIDQSADTGGAYANTYALPTVLSELAANTKSFTPTHSLVLRIAVWVVAKGTGHWTLTLHDASNNVLATQTLNNSQLTNGAMNYFYVPYTWTSGVLHFHITSTVNDGTSKSNVANDLSTTSFVQTYSNKGDYLLLFHNDAHAYSLTNASFTPTDLGSIGADNGMVRGTVFNNLAIFANGLQTNSTKKWDATTLANLGGFPKPANQFTVFQKRVFTNDTQTPSNARYCEADDPEVWNTSTNFITIRKGDGDDITAFTANNDSLQVYKDTSVNAVNFSFDNSYNLTVPQQQPITNTAGGVAATGSCLPVYGYTYFLSKMGFQSYGPSPDRVVADTPLPLSLKIEPTVTNINLLYRENINSVFYDRKYITSAPLGYSTTNDTQFVYNESIKRRFGRDNWVIYKGIPALSFSIFRDTNKKDQLYFCSTLEPKLFRFNTTFSDDGFGYERYWRSKTFQFGERTRWIWLDIEGSMTQNTTIFVDINTDGIQESGFEINSENLLQSTTGSGYIGDSYVGDLYVGGAEAGESTPLYKFKKRIYLPSTINYGYQSWFQLRNNAEGEGWKINRFRIAYSVDPEDPTNARTTA